MQIKVLFQVKLVENANEQAPQQQKKIKKEQKQYIYDFQSMRKEKKLKKVVEKSLNDENNLIKLLDLKYQV